MMRQLSATFHRSAGEAFGWEAIADPAQAGTGHVQLERGGGRLRLDDAGRIRCGWKGCSRGMGGRGGLSPRRLSRTTMLQTREIGQ
jgi:hypothetical protein